MRKNENHILNTIEKYKQEDLFPRNIALKNLCSFGY